MRTTAPKPPTRLRGRPVMGMIWLYGRSGTWDSGREGPTRASSSRVQRWMTPSPERDRGWGISPSLLNRASPPGDLTAIGRYRVERLLGEGGFGRVYLAHDDQFERPVAIKVPRPGRLSRPEDAEAYLAEARTVASLDHPNIVPVFDVGRHGRRPLLRRLEGHRGQRPGEEDPAGPPVARRSGRTGGDRRRGPALRPPQGAGPPGHQARQHPARRRRQALSSPTSGWP